MEPLTYHSTEILYPFRAVIVEIRGKKALGYVLRQVGEPSFKTAKISEVCTQKLTKIQIALLNFISRYYVVNYSLAVDIFTPSDENVGIIKHEQSDFKTPNLNANQQDALNFAKSHKTSLIFGDTGSGKSEIYFSLIREYLLADKQVLLLMPEISLTPQMTKRLKSYFGEKFGVWHSKITPKKRGEILQKFQSREINLIAGARSALFLPFTELGLIIVDEEHDDSYKSAQNPHYNARDLALFLASKFDVKVLLGSATPSVVSFKKQPHFRLKGTFFKSEKKFIYDESETGLSDVILGELAASFAGGKQAVVFLPTRANFHYLSCRECGSTIKCPFCSVGMSFYKKRNVLKCQYCGFTMSATCSCEKCGSEMIEAKKIGTDELTDALRSAFPAARIEKFDRDEITTQNKLEKTLKAFNAGEIDALVGTQITVHFSAANVCFTPGRPGHKYGRRDFPKPVATVFTEMLSNTSAIRDISRVHPRNSGISARIACVQQPSGNPRTRASKKRGDGEPLSIASTRSIP